MRSLKSRIINVLLRLLGAKKMFADFHANVGSPDGFKAAVEKARAGGQFSALPPEKLASAYSNEQIDVDGFGLSLIKVGQQEKVVYFLHGGAYVLGTGSAHWDLMERVGKQADCHVAVFDYPLAPEHTAEMVLERSQDAYLMLVERYSAENVILMGGSAGAGLAMGLGLKLRDEKQPLPAKIVLLYPWLDVTMSHPEARGFERKDLLLGVDGLIACGKFYAGEMGVEHPYVSPWYGNTADMPPVAIFTGTCDVLHPEGRDYAQKIISMGGHAELFTFEEMQHAWVIFDMPESMDAISKVSHFINSD